MKGFSKSCSLFEYISDQLSVISYQLSVLGDKSPTTNSNYALVHDGGNSRTTSQPLVISHSEERSLSKSDCTLKGNARRLVGFSLLELLDNGFSWRVVWKLPPYCTRNYLSNEICEWIELTI